MNSKQIGNAGEIRDTVVIFSLNYFLFFKGALGRI